MLDDFPTLNIPGQTFMFADDIEFRVHAKDGLEAEKLLTPFPGLDQKMEPKMKDKIRPDKIQRSQFLQTKAEAD